MPIKSVTNLRGIQGGNASVPRFRLIGSLGPGAGSKRGDPLAAVRATAAKQADGKITSFGAAR